MTAYQMHNVKDEINQRIATRFSALAQYKEASSKSLAKTAGTSRSRVSAIMNGSSEARATELVLFARCLGVTASVITGETPLPVSM